jgi:hypothetical protein
MSSLGRALRAVGLGLWHFVVGDTPEFLLAVVVLVGFALAVHETHPAEWFGLPVLVLVVLVVSLLRQTRRGERPSEVQAPGQPAKGGRSAD